MSVAALVLLVVLAAPLSVQLVVDTVRVARGVSPSWAARKAPADAGCESCGYVVGGLDIL